MESNKIETSPRRLRAGRALAFVALGIVVVAALAVWLARGRGAPSIGDVAPAPRAMSAESSGAARTDPSARGVPSIDAEAQPIATAALHPPTSASATPATPPRTIEVEVREASTGETLAGARVWLRRPDMTDAPDAVEVRRLGWPAYLEAWATPHEVGPDGRARIENVVGTPRLVATWAHYLGGAPAPRNDGGFAAIAVSPRFHPKLELVDTLGAPAIGAEVRYVCSAGPAWPTTLPLSDARLQVDYQLYVARGFDVRLQATPLGGTAQEFPLDRSMLVEEPTRLVLANTGQLEVRVAGVPPSGVVPSAMAYHVGISGDGTTSSALQNHADPMFDGTLVDGRATCAALAVGTALFVRVDAPGFIGAGPTVHCAGPTRAGEIAVVDVPISAWAVISGRALESDGHPISNANLRVEWSRGWTVTTTASGRFALPVSQHACASEPRSLGFRFRAAYCEIALPAVIEGDLDLGDVVLTTAADLASGRVVDEQGRSIAGATVAARGDADIASTETAEDGSFSLRTFGPHPRFDLIASHGWYIAQRVECAQGARDVVIRLTRGAALRARVRVDRPEDAAGVSVSLRYTGRTGPEWDGQLGFGSTKDAVPGVDEREYQWTGLVPGEYSLSVRVDGNGGSDRIALAEELGTSLRSIALGPSEERDVEIDLRGKLSVVRVRVLAADGGALSDARVHTTFVDEEGRASLVTTSKQPELAITCEGWLGQRVAIPADGREHDVRLEPAPEIRFALTAPELAAGEALDWYATWSAHPEDRDSIDESVVASGLRWEPPCAGRFSIRARLVVDDERATLVGPDPPVLVHVFAGAPKQTIALHITAAALEQARQTLAAGK